MCAKHEQDEVDGDYEEPGLGLVIFVICLLMPFLIVGWL